MLNDKSLLDEFITESKEYLHSIEEDFITLENQKEKTDREIVNKIFRAIHSIKGSAGFFGMKNISTVAHVMETLLSMIREGDLTPKTEYIDALLEGVDTLNSLLDDIENSNSVDIVEIHDKISELIHADAKESVKQQLTASLSVRDKNEKELDFTLTDYSLQSLPDEYRYFYVLTYNLHSFEKNKGKSPVTLVNELLKTGSILDGLLSGPGGDIYEGVPTEELEVKILYATMIDPGLITLAVELENDYIQEIHREDLKKATKTVVSHEDEEKTPQNTAAMAETRAAQVQQPILGADKGNRKNSESIRIKLEILDQLMLLAGELVLVRNQQLLNFNKDDPLSRTISQRLDIVTTDIQEAIMQTRMQPIGNIFGKFSRIVRDLGKKLGKKISIDMSGNEVELDKTILEALVDPLTHIIRNSCDHGIELPEVRKECGKNEEGTIVLKAYHESGQIYVEISDDGKGIDSEKLKNKVHNKGIKNLDELNSMSEKEVLSYIFLPGISTTEVVGDLSGRGVGMDVVKTSIEHLGGIINLESEKGKGMNIQLRLPLTLAIIPSLIVQSNGNRYAIPQINLVELVCLYDEDIKNQIECAGHREVFRLRDILLPIVHLEDVLLELKPFNNDIKRQNTDAHKQRRMEQYAEFVATRKEGRNFNWSLNFAVIKVGAVLYGLVIDEVLGTEEIVVKPMHRSLKTISIYSGATVLGDGQVALILDANGIANHAGVQYENLKDEKELLRQQKMEEQKKCSLLIFKSGENEQFAIETAKIKRIEKIKTAKIESAGKKQFLTLHDSSVRVLRLDNYMQVSPCLEKEEMFLLLPKHSPQPYGVLLSQLVDIGEYSLDINQETYTEPGVYGTAVINNKMTLFVDIDEIAQVAEPHWFAHA